MNNRIGTETSAGGAPGGEEYDFEIDPNAMQLEKKLNSSPGMLSVKFNRQSEGKSTYQDLASSQGE
jgi:hypothetical protein